MSEPVRFQAVEPIVGHGRPLSFPVAGEVAAQRPMGGGAAGCCTEARSRLLGRADSPPSRPSPIKGEGEFGPSGQSGFNGRLPLLIVGRAS